jgi:hypothetical protein
MAKGGTVMAKGGTVAAEAMVVEEEDVVDDMVEEEFEEPIFLSFPVRLSGQEAWFDVRIAKIVAFEFSSGFPQNPYLNISFPRTQTIDSSRCGVQKLSIV